MESPLGPRKKQILEILAEKGSVDVAELSDQFQVSRVIIRRDLSDLEANGLLTRIRGGAISSYKNYYNMDFRQRSSTNEAEKKRIAAYIAEQVKENDTVMLNAGTTTLFVYRLLANRSNISIVTNSIAIALEAAANEKFNTILLGGSVNSQYRFTYGDDTLRQLSMYHADKLILSVDGINEKEGLSSYYHQESEICRQMMENAKTTIVAADHTKIGRCAFATVAKLSGVHQIVTGESAPKQEIQTLKKHVKDIVQV